MFDSEDIQLEAPIMDYDNPYQTPEPVYSSYILDLINKFGVNKYNDQKRYNIPDSEFGVNLQSTNINYLAEVAVELHILKKQIDDITEVVHSNYHHILQRLGRLMRDQNVLSLSLMKDGKKLANIKFDMEVYVAFNKDPGQKEVAWTTKQKAYKWLEDNKLDHILKKSIDDADIDRQHAEKLFGLAQELCPEAIKQTFHHATIKSQIKTFLSEGNVIPDPEESGLYITYSPMGKVTKVY